MKLLFALLIASASFSLAQSSLRQDGPDFLLENELLAVRVKPESSGRITSIVFKRTGEELLAPLEEKVFRISPLVPEHVDSNNAGYKDLIWGRYVYPRLPFTATVINEGPEAAILSVRGQIGPIQIVRTITLLSGSAVVDQAIKATNVTKAPQEWNYWAHLLLNPAVFTAQGRSTAIFHTLGQGDAILTKVTERFAKPGIKEADLKGSYLFASPAAPWLARIAPGSKTGLMMKPTQFSPGDGTLFSLWQSEGANSLEIILPTQKLAPEKSAEFGIDLAVVPDAAGLSAWVGDVAILQHDDQLFWQRLGQGFAETLEFSGLGEKTFAIPDGQALSRGAIGPVKKEASGVVKLTGAQGGEESAISTVREKISINSNHK